MLKKKTTIKQVNFNQLMNQKYTTGVNFELIDDNNRTENAAAKNDLFRGTVNYITSENTFSLE